MRIPLSVAALCLALAVPAAPQTPASGQVAVLVAIPIPAAMPRQALVAEFEKSVPQYRQLPGLVRKYYTIGDDNRAGGIYLFASRAAAEAWFTPEWRSKVQARWGSPPEVSYFAVPVTVDGTAAGR